MKDEELKEICGSLSQRGEQYPGASLRYTEYFCNINGKLCIGAENEWWRVWRYTPKLNKREIENCPKKKENIQDIVCKAQESS